MLSKAGVLTLFTLWIANAYNHVMADATGITVVDDLRYEISNNIETLWTDLEDINDINGSGLTDAQLLQRFRSLTRIVTREEGVSDLGGLGKLEGLLSYAQLDAQVSSITAFFDTFKRFQNEQLRWRHQLEWTDIAMYFLDESKKGVKSTLDVLHKITISDSTTIFKEAIGETRKYICEMEQSEQQMIYNLYNTISIADLKGYTMLNFAWMLLKLYDKGNFTTEVKLMKELYTNRMMEKVNAARDAMKGADRSLYRCDAKTWIEGENYVRLTKLLQGYIENEVNLNPYGTCSENCAYYQLTTYHGCFKQQFCSQQRPCQGQILHCTYVDSDMSICKSSSETRRYDYVEYENGSVLGTRGTCPNRNLVKVDSWWRYLFWHCSYCFCLCDDNHPSSDRYFNMREVTSDTANNKVITGVRFAKEKQVIHVKIQQGQLSSHGTINGSLEWVPVKNYSVMDHDVQDGVDYHTMTWKERSVDLDDITAPPDHVLTGVRFRKIGGHLNLEIRTTPFNFTSGKLGNEVESAWLSNDNTDGSLESPRREVILPNPDIPTRRGTHLPGSRHDEFIKFRETSKSADAAQTTVPFLDSQPVESRRLPLSGLGLHYRGTLNSGGFLAFKAITFDFSPYMIPLI